MFDSAANETVESQEAGNYSDDFDLDEPENINALCCNTCPEQAFADLWGAAFDLYMRDLKQSARECRDIQGVMTDFRNGASQLKRLCEPLGYSVEDTRRLIIKALGQDLFRPTRKKGRGLTA